jgi:hypothetical protein
MAGKKGCSGRPRTDPIKRFWSHVNKNGPIHPVLKTKCWVWTSTINKKSGYGQITLPGHLKKYAHRFSWEIHFESIPEGLNVCHKCDNRLCVNPDHIFIGTDFDNEQDKWRKGRGKHPIGELNGYAKLTVNEVIQIRQLYATGKHTYVSIANIFHITFQTVHSIVKYKIWKHI